MHALEHLKKSAGRVRGAKGIKRHNALFHLFENASKSAKMYHEILHFQTSEIVHYAFLCLLRLSHDLQTFLNVLMHADLFSGMYTSQGSGDILVRMCGSWENFVVHLRTFRRIFKQVK